MPFVDDAAGQVIGEIIAGEFDMLLGRRTYQIFAAYWPNQGDHPIAKAFNRATKYVVTRSLVRFDWEKSQRIDGDVVEEVRRLKTSDGPRRSRSLRVSDFGGSGWRALGAQRPPRHAKCRVDFGSSRE